MKLIYSFTFFVGALILHIGLLYLFAYGFYLLYFLNLFVDAYLLYRYYNHFSIMLFFIFLALVFSIINIDIYDEYVFEFFLYLDAVDRSIYINSEVMYVLVVLHLLLLANLKKFENFWAIIDKKLFGI